MEFPDVLNPLTKPGEQTQADGDFTNVEFATEHVQLEDPEGDQLPVGHAEHRITTDDGDTTDEK